MISANNFKFIVFLRITEINKKKLSKKEIGGDSREISIKIYQAQRERIF